MDNSAGGFILNISYKLQAGDIILFDYSLIGRVTAIDGDTVLIKQSDGRIRRRNYIYDLEHGTMKVISPK